MIFTLYPLGIAAAVANLVVEGSRLDISGTSGTNHRIAGYLYAAGAFFAALHFAFGPRDLSILKRISEKDKDNEAAMADWVRMNLVRGLIADLPSWVCYFAGFMLAVSWICFTSRLYGYVGESASREITLKRMLTIVLLRVWVDGT